MTDYQAIVVGGGPAGSTAAALLARSGVEVLVLEEKRMPREKLCGEFVTPECFPVLQVLGVFGQIEEESARITRVALYAGSREVETAVADISHGAGYALGISRARFDEILFKNAREAGAHCIEGMAVRKCVPGTGSGTTVECLSLDDGGIHEFAAPLIIDASGRNSRLMVLPNERRGGRRGFRRYALKAHLAGVQGISDQMEFYFFRGGYGGLSRVENGLANLCFILNESSLREAGGDPELAMKRTIMSDHRAARRLANASVEGKWHSAGPLSFGKRRLARPGIVAIGDAAGMIDPFTGTGIQIALRTGELAARSVGMALGLMPDPSGIALGSRNSTDDMGQSSLADRVSAAYEHLYLSDFSRRMAVAGTIRRAVFSRTGLWALGGLMMGVPGVTRRLLKATRTSGRPRTSEL